MSFFHYMITTFYITAVLYFTYSIKSGDIKPRYKWTDNAVI